MNGWHTPPKVFQAPTRDAIHAVSDPKVAGGGIVRGCHGVQSLLCFADTIRFHTPANHWAPPVHTRCSTAIETRRSHENVEYLAAEAAAGNLWTETAASSTQKLSAAQQGRTCGGSCIVSHRTSEGAGLPLHGQPP